MNFNHKVGCQKCTAEGEYDSQFRRMSFPDINAIRRSNDSFRDRTQLAHHKPERSLFETLNIDMISSFPTSDSLHLLDLGIMKKCISRWVFGAKGYDRKWSKALVKHVSFMLLIFQQQMPSDIHRSVRSLDTLIIGKVSNSVRSCCILVS